MVFNLIYWTPMSGSYFCIGSNLEKCGKFWENGRFSGRIRPDWGNTAWADMAGLGSIGLKESEQWQLCKINLTLMNNICKCLSHIFNKTTFTLHP